MRTEAYCPKSERHNWSRAEREIWEESSLVGAGQRFGTCDEPIAQEEWKEFYFQMRQKVASLGKAEWVQEEDTVIGLVEMEREAQIERTREKVRELQKRPEFIAALKAIDESSDENAEVDVELVRNLEERKYRREAIIARYGREISDLLKRPSGE